MNWAVTTSLICLIGVYTGIQIHHVLKTGVARWLGGEATREYNAARYWRYVCEAWVALILSSVVAIAMTLASFR
jgi:hypothetical protein